MGVALADLQDLLLTRVPTNKPARSGFYEFKCPMCSDYKVRAGIRFAPTEIQYNCFNCDGGFFFKDGDCHVSRKLEGLFTSLGGDPSDLAEVKKRLIIASLGAANAVATEVRVDGINQFKSPPVVAIPPSFKTLEAALASREPIAQAAMAYLDRRQIQIDKTFAMVDTGTKKKNPWRHRIILPVIMWGKTVGLTGRSWDNDPSKYHTLGSKGTMIFNFDTIAEYPDRPLFIVEGQFDALRINGVAVMGNKMSPHQVHWLQQSTRRKVIVPDKGVAGYPLIEQAVALGWEVALPDFGSRKDVDAAVAGYGLLYVTKQLLSSIYADESALLRGRAYCAD